MAEQIGLINTIFYFDEHKGRWNNGYVIFYDIDKQLTYHREIKLYDILMPYTYLVYSTKHGYHVIVLTIMDLYRYAKVYTRIHRLFKSWYTGTVIRVSLKENEIQSLWYYNDTNTMIPKEMAIIYEKRFNIEFKESKKVDSKVFFTIYNTNKV